MKKFVKIVFAILLVVCSGVFGSIYVAQKAVADSYKVNRGEELIIDSVLPITVSYDGVRMSQGSYTRQVGETFEVDLKIFGVIPFSTVNVEVVDEVKEEE